MYFFVFRVLPGVEHPMSGEIGGAFVSCWIERATQEEAEKVAREAILLEPWVIESVEEAYPITRADYDGAPDGLPYFEQAIVDKEVFVFYTYPVDEPTG